MVVSKLKAVYVFIYLKSKLSLQNPDLTDITVRPGKACSAFHKLKKKSKSKQYSLGTKIRLYKGNVVLLHGSECRRDVKIELGEVGLFHHKCF